MNRSVLTETCVQPFVDTYDGSIHGTADRIEFNLDDTRTGVTSGAITAINMATGQHDTGMENNWQCDNSETSPGPTCILSLAGATHDFIAGVYLVTIPLRSHDGITNYFRDID